MLVYLPFLILIFLILFIFFILWVCPINEHSLMSIDLGMDTLRNEMLICWNPLNRCNKTKPLYLWASFCSFTIAVVLFFGFGFLGVFWSTSSFVPSFLRSLVSSQFPSTDLFLCCLSPPLFCLVPFSCASRYNSPGSTLSFISLSRALDNNSFSDLTRCSE